MSGTAVFRSAARRVLRPATRFRRNNEQPFSPMQIITPRRHYSAGGVNMEEVNNPLFSRPVLSSFFNHYYYRTI
jgi:hypothetical protein